MSAFRVDHYAAGRLWWLALAALLMRPLGALGATEDTFDVLQIGTRTYTNVTVTTKAKTYIFILHAGGMASIKLSEIPPELQQQLGYGGTPASKNVTNTATAWVKKEVAKMDVPQVKDLRQQLRQWRAHPPARLAAMVWTGSKPNYIVLGIVLLVGLLLYLFYSYCCMLICRKAGHPPGILVWLPALQLIPMLRAAGMSGWWFGACFVPVLNLVPVLLWPFKIAKARGKSAWIGVLLLLPGTNLTAFLYLAFSDGAAGTNEEGSEPKVMSLQTV
jgi:uncharacterized membrane protein YhaH (DUF805 family)